MHLPILTLVLVAGAAAQAPPASIPFTRLRTTELAIGEPGTAVIRDEATWRTLWTYFGREHRSPVDPEVLGRVASPPAVDFARFMVIAVGQGSTSGCSHTAQYISRIEATADQLRVVLGAGTIPQLPDIGCRMLIQPVDAVMVPRDRRAVVFVGARPEYQVPGSAEWWRAPSVDAALGTDDEPLRAVSWRVLTRDSTLPVSDLRRLALGVGKAPAGGYEWSLLANPRVAANVELLAILVRGRIDVAARARHVLFERHAIPVALDRRADTTVLRIVIERIGYGPVRPDIALLVLENAGVRRHEPLLGLLIRNLAWDATLCRRGLALYASRWLLGRPSARGGFFSPLSCPGSSQTDVRAGIPPRVWLEHVCGTTFHAVNTHARAVEITWEVVGTPARGGLLVPAPPTARLRGEMLLTTGQPGVVHLYVGGRLIAIHANQSGGDGVEQFQPTAPLTASDSGSMTAIGREIVHSSEPCGNRRCSYSDAAVYQLIADTVPPIPSQLWILGRIARPAWGCFPGPCNPLVLDLSPSPYWVVDTTHETFVVNDLVSKIGSATGWSQGYVQSTCVNVSPAQGVTYYCQMYANYGQGDGDSGAPILLDIQGGTDSTVTLGGIHSGKAGKNAVFSPWSGIVQDYGSLSVVPAQQDTTRPPVPQSPALPDDSTRTVPSPSGTAERYYRDIVGVMFDDTTSGTTIRAILKKYQASIIAGGVVFPYPVYYLQVPDPGGTYAAISSVAKAIDGEPGVFATLIPQWRGRVQIRSRYPNDGPSARRADWSSPTDATRALLAIRAPLAWGCETGAYGQTVGVAIIDRQFEAHNDLVTREIRPPVNPIDFGSISTIIGDLEHGNQVAGIFGATGDNSMGIAGMMWRSDLTLYALGAQGGLSRNPYHDFLLHLVHINDTLRTRILSMSATFGNAATDTTNIGVIVQALQIYFRNGGMLIYAIGNDRHARPTLAQLRTTTDTAFSGLDKAVAILRDSLGFANNIITVGATGTTGAFLDSTTYWLGGTDILASGEQILTLGVSNTTSLAPYGTSYATSYVAGVVAQLLAMDPTLTAAQVKDFILRGARQPRGNPQTGQEDSAQAVLNAPETIYQLDAYGALQLAARRQGAPLCGNRAWAEGSRVVTERNPDPDARTTEELFVQNDTIGYVNVRHGGRRLEVYSTQSGPKTFVYDYPTRRWTASPVFGDEPDGGTFLSVFETSHGFDSAVVIRQITSGPPVDEFSVAIYDSYQNSERRIATIGVAVSNSTSPECVLWQNELWIRNVDGTTSKLRDASCKLSAFVGSREQTEPRGAFAPVGDRVLLAVSKNVTQSSVVGQWQPCPWSEAGEGGFFYVGEGGDFDEVCRTVRSVTSTNGATVYGVAIRSGTVTLSWPVAARAISWLGVSEQGHEVVLGEGQVSQTSWYEPDPNGFGFHLRAEPQVLSNCAITYRLLATGASRATSVASDEVCKGQRGQGTIAPAPPVAAAGGIR
jgi:hypothetical protein